MARERIINADWDAEAGVWVATSDDVPGLVTEAKTFETLLKKLRRMVPELIELNGAGPNRDVYRVQNKVVDIGSPIWNGHSLCQSRKDLHPFGFK